MTKEMQLLVASEKMESIVKTMKEEALSDDWERFKGHATKLFHYVNFSFELGLIDSDGFIDLMNLYTEMMECYYESLS